MVFVLVFVLGFLLGKCLCFLKNFRMLFFFSVLWRNLGGGGSCMVLFV